LGREIFGPLFYNQIKAAELLLFNKIDLVPDGDIPCFLEGIREINPSCSIVPTYRCQIDPNVLWQSLVPTEREKEVHFHHFPSDSADAEGIGFVTFSFENESPFESDCFRHFIATLPVEVFRVKGFAVLEDKRVLVNHVGGKTEWADVNETGPTKLTFIGWQVDAEQILGRLKKCL
jgi:G3E family GTPase